MTIFEALALVGSQVSPTEREVQIRCPIHGGGQEQNRSARVYPATDSLFCWTCHRSWTPYQLIAAHHGCTPSEAKRVYGGGSSPRSSIQSRSTDRATAEVLQALSRMPTSRSIPLLKAFDSILVDAARGAQAFLIRQRCREFVVAHIVPHVGRYHG